jgi:DNA-binding NarL/FixJ family response regulator
MSGAQAERPARILVVDDEPLNVDYLEQELEERGFVIETASNGLEALDRVAAQPPDLVLLDVMMPGMDGISALRALKGDPETRLIPVVLMTALNAVEDRVRGIEAGADDFLSKPVDDRELLARIRTALASKRAIDEAVGELRSLSAQLERYGVQERDVAILAVEWRAREADLPDGAVGFVSRRQRDAARAWIRDHGGTPSEDEANPLVAVFDGPDPRSRAVAAVEAALAATREEASGTAPGAIAGAAVAAGRARVGSSRVTEAGEARWLFGARGEPVERASALAHGALSEEVLVARETAELVRDEYRLEPADEEAYRVVGPGDQDASPGSERRIRTILVTDIVGSTGAAERLGDRAWSELSAEHDRAVRRELLVFGGDEINTTGDGFIAAFGAPAEAIRCALVLMERIDAIGLRIRAGIHTGEVEYEDGRAQGIAFNLATRISGLAGSAEVLVSATTRELAAGSGLEFTDRGEHALKGVSGSRRLYAAADHAAPPAPAPDGEDEGGYPAGLTAREVDVLRLVALGLSDAEVAERLVLSVRTVNAHLRSVYRKLGVRSRAAAGRFAQSNGLV